MDTVGVRAEVEGVSGFESSARQVISSIGNMNNSAKGLASGVSALTGGFGALIGVLGMMGGSAIAGIFDSMAQGIGKLVGKSIDLNVFYQNAQLMFETMLSDSAMAGETMETTMSDGQVKAIAKAGDGVAQVNERVQDLMIDHGARVSDIQMQITETVGAGIAERQEQLGQALADLFEKHVSTIAALNAQIADVAAQAGAAMADRIQSANDAIERLNESHNKRLVDMAEQREDAITSAAERSAERLLTLQEQLDDALYNFELRKQSRQEQLEEQKAGVAERFMKQRENLAKNLAAATDKISAKAIQTEIAAIDADEKAALDKLDAKAAKEAEKEQVAYDRQLAKTQARLAKEEADQAKALAKRLEAIQKNITEEDAEYSKQRGRIDIELGRDLAKISAQAGRQIAALQARITEENALYEKQRVKLEQDAAKDIAKQQLENDKKTADLQKQLDKENMMYERQMRDIQRSASAAAEAVSAANSGGNKKKAYSDKGEMLAPGGLLAGIEGDVARGQAMMDKIKDMAQKLPGDVTEATSAAVRLLSLGLDPTKWLAPLAGAAKLFNKPLEQVSNALGQLAMGRGGEAVQMLLEAGINLREVLGSDAFDMQGALIVPLDEAFPKIYDFLVKKYMPLIDKMSKGWETGKSNLGDYFDAFLKAASSDAFKEANKGLNDFLDFLQDPKTKAAINDLSEAINSTLKDAVTGISDAIKWMGDNWETVQPILIVVGAILLGTFVAVAAAISVVVVGLVTFGAAIGIAVAALAALGVGIVWIGTWLKDNLWPAVEGFFLGVADVWGNFYNTVAPPIMGFFQMIGDLWGNSINFTVGLIRNLWGIIGPMFEGGINFILGWLSVFFGAVKITWELVQDKFETVTNYIWALIVMVWTIISGFFTTTWQAIWDGIILFWGEDENSGIQKVFWDVMNNIGKKIHWVWEGEDGKGGIKGFFEAVWSAISVTIDTKTKEIRDLLLTIWALITSGVENFLGKDDEGGLRRMFVIAFTAIKDSIKAIMNVAIKAVNLAINAANAGLEALWRAGGSLGSKPWIRPIDELNFDKGGVVPGRQGEPVSATVHGGEGVLSVQSMSLFNTMIDKLAGLVQGTSGPMAYHVATNSYGGHVDNRQYSTNIEAHYAKVEDPGSIQRTLAMQSMLARAGV